MKYPVDTHQEKKRIGREPKKKKLRETVFIRETLVMLS